MRRRPLDVALSITLLAGLAFPFFLRHAFAQGYRLADSVAVQRLPDRQGGLSGMKTAAPRIVVLPDGTSIVVYVVERIDIRARPPFKIGDVLYAVNGMLFTSLDGMPRYVQSLPPGSTAAVEYLQVPPKRRRGRTVLVEQTAAVSAAVEIISISSRYACPSCPKPPPKTPAEEAMARAPYIVAGHLTGTFFQAIFNALGLGPDRVFELIMKNRPPINDNGPPPTQRIILENTDKAPEKPPPAPPTPAIDPFFSKNPLGVR